MGAIETLIGKAPGGLTALFNVRKLVNRHDRKAKEFFEDLNQWIVETGDQTQDELLGIRQDLNRRGFPPGTSSMEAGEGNALLSKRLVEYGKEHRKVERSLHEIRDTEGALHALYRKLKKRPLPSFATSPDAKEILEFWDAGYQ